MSEVFRGICGRKHRQQGPCTIVFKIICTRTMTYSNTVCNYLSLIPVALFDVSFTTHRVPVHMHIYSNMHMHILFIVHVYLEETYVCD